MKTKILLFVLLSFMIGDLYAINLNADDYYTTQTNPAEGMTLIAKEHKTSPSLAIYALRFNLKNFEIVPFTGKGKLFQGETVGDAYKRLTKDDKNVVALVNGDFWESKTRLYHPIGMLVEGGAIKNYQKSVRSTLYNNGTQWNINVPKMTAHLNRSNASYTIDDINPPTTGTALAIYTWSDPRFDKDRYVWKKATLKKPTLLPNEKNDGTINSDTDPKLKENEILIAAEKESEKSRMVEGLADGETVELEIKAAGLDGTVTAAIGGGPRLMRDGDVSVENQQEKIGKDFTTTKHPRTAVGFDKARQTAWLVVIDGRQEGYSMGIDLYDLAMVMKYLGCYDAMNLDGGGSSSMFVNEKYINKPCDNAGPRPVSNGLYVRKK